MVLTQLRPGSPSSWSGEPRRHHEEASGAPSLAAQQTPRELRASSGSTCLGQPCCQTPFHSAPMPPRPCSERTSCKMEPSAEAPLLCPANACSFVRKYPRVLPSSKQGVPTRLPSEINSLPFPPGPAPASPRAPINTAGLPAWSQDGGHRGRGPRGPGAFKRGLGGRKRLSLAHHFQARPLASPAGSQAATLAQQLDEETRRRSSEADGSARITNRASGTICSQLPPEEKLPAAPESLPLELALPEHIARPGRPALSAGMLHPSTGHFAQFFVVGAACASGHVRDHPWQMPVAPCPRCNNQKCL